MGHGTMSLKLTKTLLVLAATVSITACDRLSGGGDTLAGPREPIRANEGFAGQIAAEVAGSAEIRLPRARTNSEWTHRGSDIDHAPDHVALAETIAPVWSVDIGAGNSRKQRITAEPVVERERIFTLDAAGVVTAVSTSGAVLWQSDIAPKRDAADASGGGLAVDDGTLYVSSAYGSLFALDAETGAVRWEQELNASGVAAPAVAGGIVYMVAGDSRAWAIDAGTGRINWTIEGAPSDGSYIGGAAPAIGPSLAIFPYATGDVQAVFRRGGFSRWTANVSGKREGFAVSEISEITADPVLDNGRVYVGNASGRIAALDASTGERIWTARNGTLGTIVPVGRNDLFTINDQNQLIRLSARDGSVIWSKQLPHYLNDNAKRRAEISVHYGPLLAGGRLIVASSDGVLRQYSVVDGSEMASVAIAGGAATAPIVVNETLYVVTAKGQLAAFR
jgi:outer membrane protein assembly factor BamB